jgi:hypothetical protein
MYLFHLSENSYAAIVHGKSIHRKRRSPADVEGIVHLYPLLSQDLQLVSVHLARLSAFLNSGLICPIPYIHTFLWRKDMGSYIPEIIYFETSIVGITFTPF